MYMIDFRFFFCDFSESRGEGETFPTAGTNATLKYSVKLM